MKKSCSCQLKGGAKAVKDGLRKAIVKGVKKSMKKALVKTGLKGGKIGFADVAGGLLYSSYKTQNKKMQDMKEGIEANKRKREQKALRKSGGNYVYKSKGNPTSIPRPPTKGKRTSANFGAFKGIATGMLGDVEAALAQSAVRGAPTY